MCRGYVSKVQNHWAVLALVAGGLLQALPEALCGLQPVTLTSEGLLYSILAEVRNQSKRANLKKWVYPNINDGEWSLGHSNPTKIPPRDIMIWDEERLLSVVIDAGSY